MKKTKKTTTKAKDEKREFSKVLQKKIKDKFPKIKSKYVGDGITEFTFN
jgi:hypothetical protein